MFLHVQEILRCAFQPSAYKEIDRDARCVQFSPGPVGIPSESRLGLLDGRRFTKSLRACELTSSIVCQQFV